MSEGTAKKGFGEKPQPKEEKARKFQAIRGVRDILPPETALWTRVEQTAHEVFATYNFGEIRLPIFEQTDLFARAVGGETDIVSKEMYTFDDKPTELPSALPFLTPKHYTPALEQALRENPELSTVENNSRLALLKKHLSVMEEAEAKGDSRASSLAYDRYVAVLETLLHGDRVSLRPEATASVCRAYIEHGMQSLPQPVKLYYMGPMFRRERPQKGRYRQFYQIGAEILGGPDAPAIDAEVIEMLMTFFDKCSLTGTTLYINSIGHNAPNCRRGYVEKLRAELTKIKDKLGPDSQRRIDTNPLRVLDSKMESEQPYIEKLPRIADSLCDECKAHYAAVKRELDLRGVKYQENWRLVRGLDYYMRTTFEITAPGLGSQNAVCGGGRYDGLVELLGGPPTKGIGFAIGQDRLVLSLQSQGIQAKRAADVLIAWQDEQSYSQARSLAALLREVGLSIVMPRKAMRPGEAVGMASKSGVPIGIIIGPSEVSAGVFSIKILSEGTQASVPQNRAEEVGRLLLFRALLEKNFAKVAANHGIPTSGRSVLSLVSDLTTRGVLPRELSSYINQALGALNRAVHGESLTEEERTTAISNALFVLYRISALQWMAV